MKLPQTLADRRGISIANTGAAAWPRPADARDNWWQNGYVNHPRLENPVPATEEDIALTSLTSIESEGCVTGRCLRVRMKQFEPGSLSLQYPST
jgi:hypothetical protein